MTKQKTCNLEGSLYQEAMNFGASKRVMEIYGGETQVDICEGRPSWKTSRKEASRSDPTVIVQELPPVEDAFQLNSIITMTIGGEGAL